MAPAFQRCVLLSCLPSLLGEGSTPTPIDHESVLLQPVPDRGDASVERRRHLPQRCSAIDQDLKFLLGDPALVGVLALVHRLETLFPQVIADSRWSPSDALTDLCQ